MADEKATERMLTAGELMRRRLGLGSSRRSDAEISSPKQKDTVDLDSEIQRLEAALRQGDDDDDDESRSSSSDDSQSSGSSAAKVAGKRSRGKEPSSSDDDATGSGGVLCLSTVKDDRIEALPTQYLPTNKKRVLRNVDRDEAPGGTSSKKKRSVATSATTTARRSQQVSSGLERAVKEVLEGYQPRSSERLAFYCRVCAKQYGNEDDFFQHRQTDFHQAAVEMERKMSYCKLCRRQLTSPAQLKEHLRSKPHKERLAHMQSNRRIGRSGT